MAADFLHGFHGSRLGFGCRFCHVWKSGQSFCFSRQDACSGASLPSLAGDIKAWSDRNIGEGQGRRVSGTCRKGHFLVRQRGDCFEAAEVVKAN